MAATSSDKALLGAAATLVVLSAAAFGYLGYKQMLAPSGPPPRVELLDAVHEPVASEAPPVKAETWAAPVAQTRGREWIYDTFTPPEIFYNARSRQFTVRPPSSLLDEEFEVFGLELVAVRPEPFRLQLIGFVGDGNSWKGMFQNVVSGETILATSGHRVAKLGLTIKRFDVKSQEIGLPESMSSRQRVATAVVTDEKTGRDVVLSHRERMFTGTLSAFVAAPGETTTREVRTGDVFKLGDATFKVEKLELDPPTVDVTKEAPSLTQPYRQTLRPREADAPDAPEGGS